MKSEMCERGWWIIERVDEELFGVGWKIDRIEMF